MTAADVIQQTQHKMGVTVEKLRDDFTRIRTAARARVCSTRFASTTTAARRLSTCCSGGVGDAHTLTVQPWEKNMVKVCEKAIRDSDLGLNPPLRAIRFACRCLRLPRNAAANSPR